MAAKNGDDPTVDANFMRKPEVGWLHSDQKILSDGICYGVRYIGCLEVNASMKTLDYATRSLIAVESINRVCESAGLKTVDRRRKVDKRLRGLLGAAPKMEHAGWNVTLKITSSALQLISLDTGNPLMTHTMPNISFASAGDADTLDFVAYVAKDAKAGRACYVLECGSGLAQDVITTIGQAFELRFEAYLKCLPRHDRGLRDDPEYYNDLPGKIPPDSAVPPPTPATAQLLPSSAGPRAASSQADLIDLSSEPSTPCLTKDAGFGVDAHQYVNDPAGADVAHGTPWSPLPTSGGVVKDPFDMQPFAATIGPQSVSSQREELSKEPWYHGPISRKEAEALVCQDGEFLVRESVGSPGQYVLTGMQNDQRKHLLLVDPEGVVRTKDRTFGSVSNLINYHTSQRLPIISAESALVLKVAITKK
ncbi:unnamed protein product [Notodromas monacha]|uniref:SHC-transforming protein 1 n=1 Tax=Notodromas monacha TaxID=399045 RepID=A0A7R9G8S9_9CRUS|nr:unnamed protein product [Notodromas monacha]CAG0913595.1 unnamed protein product [Notodromas monacha]